MNNLNVTNIPGGETMLGPIVTLILGFIVIAIVLGILLYLYLSLAFMAIGKKAKDKSSGLAWIPIVGPAIIAFRASKMHWWPWLLWILFIIPIVNFVAMLIFGIYSLIWTWKLFEKAGKPGWWVLIGIGGIIPLVGFLFSIAWLVLIGITAWSK